MRKAILAALLVGGCLPADTRPEPGTVLVSTAPSEAATSGLSTEDGWSIAFERLLIGLGSTQLRGEDCVDYGEARYTRVFDFVLPMAPQKLGLVYGLGTCDVSYEISSPQLDAILGPGVTKADLSFMRVEADDPWVSEPERIAAYVLGTASREGVEKRIEWVFRGELDIDKCLSGEQGEGGTTIELEGGDTRELTIVLDPSELFRDPADSAGTPRLRFDVMADADADLDGNVTLEELKQVPASLPELPPELAEEARGLSSLPDVTLADVIYAFLVPHMARPPGSGLCEVELDDAFPR